MIPLCLIVPQSSEEVANGREMRGHVYTRAPARAAEWSAGDTGHQAGRRQFVTNNTKYLCSIAMLVNVTHQILLVTSAQPTIQHSIHTFRIFQYGFDSIWTQSCKYQYCIAYKRTLSESFMPLSSDCHGTGVCDCQLGYCPQYSNVPLVQ